MVDNIKNAPARTLTYVIGHGSDGKGGRQAVVDFLEGLVNGPASAVSDNLASFAGISGEVVQDSGLATSDIAAALATCDFLIVTSSTNLDSMRTKLAGISTGADVTAAALLGLTTKSTPVDADYVGVIDSAAGNTLKALSWANIKATLKTYFDALYQAADATIAKLGVSQAWSKGQRGVAVPITISGGTAAWALADGNVHTISVTGNFTLQLPSDIATVTGKQSGYIELTNTGNFTMSVASGISTYNAATLFTIAQGNGAKTLLTYYVDSTGSLILSGGGKGVAL